MKSPEGQSKTPKPKVENEQPLQPKEATPERELSLKELGIAVAEIQRKLEGKSETPPPPPPPPELPPEPPKPAAKLPPIPPQPPKEKIPAQTSLEEQNKQAEKRLLRLALTSRGQDDMARLGLGLKHLNDKGEKIANGTTQERHVRAMVFAENMLKTENEYFSALKKHQKERGFGSVFIEKFKRNGSKLPPEVEALRQKWVESRAGYAAHMNSTALERHLNKKKAFEGKDKRGLTALERYQRRFVTKEVVLGAEEAEQRARMEGLASRDKKGLEKLFDKLEKLPKPARVLVSAAAMGLLGGASVGFFGSTLGLIGLVMAVPSAVTAGVAMMQKDPKKRDRLATIAGGFGLLSIGGIFGGAAESATRGVHGLFGTRDKAKAKLAQREGLGNLGDVETLGKVSGDRKNAERAEEKIAADARLARTLASIGGGMAAGAELNHFMHGGAIPLPGGEAGSPQVIDHITVGDHMNGANINDGDKLIGHFAEKLRHDDFSAHTEPAAVHRLNELLDVHKNHSFLRGEDLASKQLGLEGPDGSTVLHNGDTLSLQMDKLGQPEIVLTRTDGLTHVLIDSSRHVYPLNPEIWHQIPVHHHVAVAHEQAPATANHEAPVKPPEAQNPGGILPEQNPAALPEAIGNTAPNDHDQLVTEYNQAQAAYDAGLKTPEQLSAYNTYLEHLNQYNNTANLPAHVDTSSAVTPSPETASHLSRTPAPSHLETSAANLSSGHAEQASTDAWEIARTSPAGTEVPYISHMDPNQPRWNSWVSDGNGQVHERLMVDSANGKPLAEPN